MFTRPGSPIVSKVYPPGPLDGTVLVQSLMVKAHMDMPFSGKKHEKAI